MPNVLREVGQLVFVIRGVSNVGVRVTALNDEGVVLNFLSYSSKQIYGVDLHGDLLFVIQFCVKTHLLLRVPS